MAHHYVFAMKVVTEQEPERPSLRHRLEGEKRPNRANCGKEGREPRKVAEAERMCKAAKSRAALHKPNYRAKTRRAAQAELHRKVAKKVESRIDADEVEESQTGCWTPRT